MIMRCRALRAPMLLAAVSSAATAVPVGHVAIASTGPVPTGGHSEVIAQSLVAFGDGEFSWELAMLPITETPPTPMTADPVTFVVADGPAAAVATPSGGGSGGARLAPGEAVVALPEVSFDVVAASPESGTIIGLAIAPGSGDGTFTPGAGLRDVDLVRDVLSTNEALIVNAEVSAFVVVTAGAVDAAGTTIADGSSAAMTGTITLINTSPEVATVLVAVVGPSIDGASNDIPTAPPPAPTVPTGDNGGGGGGGDTTTTSPTSTSTTNPTTTTTTEPPAAVDTDSDGLTDGEEVALGTDPNAQDSDSDGIPDGREVNSLGSNPLDTDTDSDGLTDALEVDHSCGINQPDSDGDGLGDAFEANSGFSECAVADTDGDGDDDLAEFSIGTDPRDPNCFSGPGSVCQE